VSESGRHCKVYKCLQVIYWIHIKTELSTQCLWFKWSYLHTIIASVD